MGSNWPLDDVDEVVEDRLVRGRFATFAMGKGPEHEMGGAWSWAWMTREKDGMFLWLVRMGIILARVIVERGE